MSSRGERACCRRYLFGILGSFEEEKLCFWGSHRYLVGVKVDASPLGTSGKGDRKAFYSVWKDMLVTGLLFTGQISGRAFRTWDFFRYPPSSTFQLQQNSDQRLLCNTTHKYSGF
jgi:hypothetical protein